MRPIRDEIDRRTWPCSPTSWVASAGDGTAVRHRRDPRAGGDRVLRRARLSPRAGRRRRARAPRPGSPDVRRRSRPASLGEWLEDALVEGIEAGGDAFIAGSSPRPRSRFLTTDLGARAAWSSSACTTCPRYNGIKFFDAPAMKLFDEVEDEIEADLGDPSDRPGAAADRRRRERYLAHLTDAAEAGLDGMRVVVDCANGAASDLAPSCCGGSGPTCTRSTPTDGKNINDGCAPTRGGGPGGRAARRRRGVSRPRGRTARCSPMPTGRSPTAIRCSPLSATRCVIVARCRGTPSTTVMANLGFHHAMREAGIDVDRPRRSGTGTCSRTCYAPGAVLGGNSPGT